LGLPGCQDSKELQKARQPDANRRSQVVRFMMRRTEDAEAA
jgi:hypothetical protein